jgi:hypothetical protein
MKQTIVEVDLPNGARALVRATDLERAGTGATKTSALRAFDFDDVAATLEGVSLALREALAKAAPDKVSIELGLELAVRSGKLTGLLVEGGGTASLAVTLEWNGDAADG